MVTLDPMADLQLNSNNNPNNAVIPQPTGYPRELEGITQDQDRQPSLDGIGDLKSIKATLGNTAAYPEPMFKEYLPVENGLEVMPPEVTSNQASVETSSTPNSVKNIINHPVIVETQIDETAVVQEEDNGSQSSMLMYIAFILFVVALGAVFYFVYLYFTK